MNLFKQIFDKCSVPMTVSTVADGRFVEVNQAFVDTTGFSRDEVIGRTSAELNIFTDPQVREALRETFERDGRIDKQEVELRFKNGESKLGLFDVQPIKMDETQCWLTTLTDITECKRERDLWQSNVEFDKLLLCVSKNFVNVANARIDSVVDDALARIGAFKQADRCYLFLFDWTAETMTNTHEWCAPGVAPQKDHLKDVPLKSAPWWRDTLKNGDVINYADINELPSAAAKTRRILESQEIKSILVVPLMRCNKTIGFLGFDAVKQNRDWRASDVTTLRLIGGIILNALSRRESEAQRDLLSAAVEQAAETVIITDTKGMIQYVNPAFEKISGYMRQEVIGRHTSILRSGRHDSNFYREIWATIKKGESWQGRIVNRCKDGAQYTEEITISPVFDDAGRITNYISVQRDISKELQLEHQFLQSQKMESLGRLAGGVAHDFNNLLMGMMGALEFCRDELDENHPAIEFVDELDGEVKQAADLTKQLLTFARRQVASPKIVELNQAIEDMLKMLKRIIGECIELNWQPTPNDCRVEIDPAQLNQVLANLCVNAVDSIDGHGMITIETRHIQVEPNQYPDNADSAPGDYILLAVSDTGCGMDEETVEKIFDPFFTTKVVGKGTGLGLATVYGIVRQGGGFITVYSEPGRGSSFKIHLPVKSGKCAEKAEPAAIDEQLPTGNGETILLVDDEPLVLETTARFLAKLGYEVLCKTSASEALKTVRKTEIQIDLLITDVVMPDMNGRELACAVGNLRPKLKCLFMSGYTGETLAEFGVTEKTHDFLQKPFTRIDLAQKIRTNLE